MDLSFRPRCSYFFLNHVSMKNQPGLVRPAFHFFSSFSLRPLTSHFLLVQLFFLLLFYPYSRAYLILFSR